MTHDHLLVTHQCSDIIIILQRMEGAEICDGLPRHLAGMQPLPPTMSCDKQNRFEIALRSLGACDATINFLRDQSVKEIVHQLFIQEDNITSA
jgi:hypothetical protein